MGEPIESYGGTLINNKAIALRVPYTDKDSEMEHSTNATALDNGWVWNTPLWSRKGTGYVYSDMFTTPEEAEVEFLEHLRSTGVSDEFLKEAACHHVDISTGFRNNAWVENVVGIGLSHGFIEPLESSGLMLIYENALDMIDVLQSRGFHNIPKIDKSMMNNKAKKFSEYFTGFVASHYAMAPRRSSSYWKYIASIDYNNVYFREDVATVVADKEFSHIDNYMGLPYILFGMGKNPITPKYLNRVYGGGSVHPQEVEVCSKILKEVDARNEHQKKYIRDMPTHYKYLRDNIYLNYKREIS
jgi:tryptophan halogenase